MENQVKVIAAGREDRTTRRPHTCSGVSAWEGVPDCVNCNGRPSPTEEKKEDVGARKYKKGRACLPETSPSAF